ncbi:MAG: hypothetical protein J7J76_03705 [Candidatus Latescibacteria bacterium]|nr:hypothetical protein [Candidatus Latescibacterota bacterium]
MKITISSEQEIIREAEVILMKHLGAAKTSRFLAAWRQGVGDYLEIKEGLFTEETVDSLYEKILNYQKAQQ